MAVSSAHPDDALSPAAVADPHAFFAAARAAGPVRYSDRFRAWMVFDHADVVGCFRGGKVSSDRIRPYVATLPAEERIAREPTFRMLLNWMVFDDPPDHTRLRRLAHRPFTTGALAGRRAQIEAIAADLIDRLPPGGEIDLVRDFAYPFPAEVIAEMLGVPRSDRELFKRWSDDIATLVDASDAEDRHAVAQAGVVALWDYLVELIDSYRAKPGDNLISELIAIEEDGERLGRDELVGTCALLLFGGHETTTNLIANGTLALLQRPEQADALRAEPGLMAGAVEEILRFDGPTKMSVRLAATDFELAGTRVRQGDRLLLAAGAANRDPQVFAAPDRFDVRREPNRHLGFGFGPHYCLGAALARFEGRIALRAILDRLVGLQAAWSELTWHPTLLSRGLVTLPVAFEGLA